MKKLRYHLVDVFTDCAFGGNQLAVFTDARGLGPEAMQAIAGELNLSETAFVLPLEDGRNDYRVRISRPPSNCRWRDTQLSERRSRWLWKA